MKFNEFWTALCKKTSGGWTKEGLHVGGFEFQTLAWKRPFTATSYSGNIIVEPEGKDRRDSGGITRNHFHKIWMRAAKLSKQEAFYPKNYFGLTRNASYILCMMKTILGEEEIEE